MFVCTKLLFHYVIDTRRNFQIQKAVINDDVDFRSENFVDLKLR